MLLGLSVAVWAYGVAAYRRSRAERSGLFSPQRAHAGLTGISIAAGLLAALIVLAG